jgi:hypothetical protein|tara:strand:+ start:522 stop:734 length:213 start_codon:yes stop_codon:yes gene_type:complete
MSAEHGALVPLIDAAAELFGGVRGLDGRVRATEVSNMRLRRMVKLSQIDGIKVGGRYYISRAVIDDFTSN